MNSHCTKNASGEEPVLFRTTAGILQEIPITEIIAALEKKYHVTIFFKAGWFEGMTARQSLLNLSLKEAIEEIAQLTAYKAVFIDNYIAFVPKQREDFFRLRQDSLHIVGNFEEYGKFSVAVLSGIITNGATGEPLPGATIYATEQEKGTITVNDGSFSLQLPVGEHTIKAAYVGFEETYQKILLVSPGKLDLSVYESSLHLKEVTVSAESEANIRSTQMSMVKMEAKAIKELPLIMGERDVIRSIALLPGVKVAGEFGSGFNVRGGSTDQNLILLNGVPIFNSSHIFGLTTAVNSDAVQEVTLWKGGMPARYGERVSSVMEVKIGAGTPENIKVQGGIGLLNSRLNVATPLFKNHAVLQLGGRSSYSSWLLKQIPDPQLYNSSADYYDLTGSLQLRPDSSNTISVFGYYSKDFISFGSISDFRYSNLLGSLEWEHQFNKRLTSSLLAGSSTFNNLISDVNGVAPSAASTIRTGIDYKSLKWNMDWKVRQKHDISFGTNLFFYKNNPGRLNPYGNESVIQPLYLKTEEAAEYAAYISDNIEISPRIRADLGFRYSGYGLISPKAVYLQQGLPGQNEGSDSLLNNEGPFVKQYSGPEPRLSLMYRASRSSSVKLNFNRVHQYLSLMSNAAVVTPTDVWKLSNTYLKPVRADQFALGYFRNFNSNTIETSLEVYYKYLHNVPEYRDGAKLLLNEQPEKDIINAKGFNYGLELSVSKKSGRLTGWASYTYSRAMRRTDRIWPSNYDIPHNLVLNTNYHISKRLRLGTTFTYSTGRPVTIPEIGYRYNRYQIVYFSERNAHRLPDYHRFDISLTLDETLKLRQKWRGSWTLTIINLYGRKNAYSVFYAKDTPLRSNGFRHFSLSKLYIIGIPLPTLTYNFSF